MQKVFEITQFQCEIISMTDQPTILVIDDNASARHVVESMLTNMDLRLLFADNGPDGLKEAAENQPDLILLDIMMPQMNGYEVCEKLREATKNTDVPIIMITALDDRASRIHGIECGADDFLTKPLNRIEIRTRVESIVRLNRIRKFLLEQPDKPDFQERLKQASDETIDSWIHDPDCIDDSEWIVLNCKNAMKLGIYTKQITRASCKCAHVYDQHPSVNAIFVV